MCCVVQGSWLHLARMAIAKTIWFRYICKTHFSNLELRRLASQCNLRSRSRVGQTSSGWWRHRRFRARYYQILSNSLILHKIQSWELQPCLERNFVCLYGSFVKNSKQDYQIGWRSNPKLQRVVTSLPRFSLSIVTVLFSFPRASTYSSSCASFLTIIFRKQG